jgi:hypothetical protein
MLFESVVITTISHLESIEWGINNYVSPTLWKLLSTGFIKNKSTTGGLLGKKGVERHPAVY